MRKRSTSIHSKFDQASDEIFRTYKKQDIKAFTNILIKHVEAGLNILGISSSDRFHVVCKPTANLYDRYNCRVYRTVDCAMEDPSQQENPPLPYLNLTVRRSMYGVELVASGDVNHLKTEDIGLSEEKRKCLPNFTTTVFAELGKVSNTELSRKDLVNILRYLKCAFRTYHYDQCRVIPAEPFQRRDDIPLYTQEPEQRPKNAGRSGQAHKIQTAEISGT